VPAACEFVDPISPQYTSDLVAWAAIGARTTESQVHRELASGLSMPVGFKNGTAGSVKLAVDAVRAAAGPHAFAGVDVSGTPAILYTEGNPDCHVILRGGKGAPNYDADSVGVALSQLSGADLPERIVIDASHDNSGKDHERQPQVVTEIADQIAAGNGSIVGVMMESFLVAGRQDLEPEGDLIYGQSITDACMDWDTTVLTLDRLASAVRKRREAA
jgi:3-deoxy-7-phosphoheptulonate synthase